MWVPFNVITIITYCTVTIESWRFFTKVCDAVFFFHALSHCAAAVLKRYRVGFLLSTDTPQDKLGEYQHVRRIAFACVWKCNPKANQSVTLWLVLFCFLACEWFLFLGHLCWAALFLHGVEPLSLASVSSQSVWFLWSAICNPVSKRNK